jgi:ribulose-phosphate 3-epimerase
MVSNPGDLLEAFADAGADGCTIHIELGDPRPLFERIRALGMRVGLTFEPATPYSEVEPYLAEIDVLLVMSVKTGFGGQPFIPSVLDKARAAREAIDARGLAVEIEIDGGITVDTAPLVAAAGVDILVAGTAVFGRPDPGAAVRELRAVASTVSGSR